MTEKPESLTKAESSSQEASKAMISAAPLNKVRKMSNDLLCVVVALLLNIIPSTAYAREKSDALVAQNKGDDEIAAETIKSRVYDIGSYVEDLEKTKAFYVGVFGFKVLWEWTHIEVSSDNKIFKSVSLPGLYLVGNNGMHLEFLQRAIPGNRQSEQEPINHFAIEVEDVQATYDKAISAGAKPAFPGAGLSYGRIDNFRFVHTQIIGLDGERIQILTILDWVLNRRFGNANTAVK